MALVKVPDAYIDISAWNNFVLVPQVCSQKHGKFALDWYD